MNLATLKATWTAFNDDKASRLAAAIAYSTIFSIAPLFIVLIAIVGFVLGLSNGGHGHHIAEAALVGQIEHTAGKSAAATVRELIASSYGKPRQNLIAQVIGWITFLVGASALFSTLQDALNSIWQIEGTKGGWKVMLRERLASFGMLAVVGFLLLVSLIGTLAISTFGSTLLRDVPVLNNAVMVSVVGQLSTGIIVMFVFAAMYKFLPDVDIAWHDVALGAFATAVLFIVGEALVAFYLHVAGVASSYGAAGSILVALLWIYYTAMIFLLGAEFTKVVSKDAKTSAASRVRVLTDRPAGIDPRTVATSPQTLGAPHEQ